VRPPAEPGGLEIKLRTRANKPRDRSGRRFSRFNRCDRRETTTRLQAERAI
jgi:hypothetical protein